MTPHIEAKKEEIAKTVIMPGDPLRAKMIADKYLKDCKLVNNVRGILAFTGYYNNIRVTIMASGMGIPSMGIYSYELFKFYDVDNIIRVGSCGTYTDKLNLYDIVLATNSYSESSYARVQNGYNNNIISSSSILNEKIEKYAKLNNININIGTVHTSDVFYGDNTNINDLYNNHHCLAVEMESFSLFHNANVLGKNATALFTVSDNIITGEKITSSERQNSFTQMIELVLNSIL